MQANVHLPPAPEPPSRRRVSVIVALVTVALFVAALFVLHRALAELSLHNIGQALRRRSSHQIMLSALLAAGSYGLLTLYDAIALRVIGRRVPYAKTALISFTASAIANNLGLPSLSAGSVRIRAYGSEGLSTGQIALVQLLCWITFMLGASLLTGLSLVFSATHATALIQVSAGAARWLGMGLLVLCMGYLLATLHLTEPVRIRRLQVRLPSFGFTLAQLAVSALDIICAAGCLYVLLPETINVGPIAFIGIFVLSITLGALSNVPGGLGVFESALLLLMPRSDTAGLLASVLLFRLIYYVAPFVCALSLLAVDELISLRARVSRATSFFFRVVHSVAPQLLAMTVFGTGVLLLISSVRPGPHHRLELLHGIIPLPMLELSHLAVSVIGAALLILSRGLHHRLRGAHRLAEVLLFVGAAASLLKGLDYEVATILFVTLLLLHGARGRFRRKAAVDALSARPLEAVNVGLVILGVFWLGFMSFRQVPYNRALFWEFAFDSSGPRALRAVTVLILCGAAYALYKLLRPVLPPARNATEAELDLASRCLACADDPLANLALLGDKQLLASEQGDAFLSYQRSGNSWIALGDPTGPACRLPELVWRFRELCDAHGGHCVFYLVSSEKLPLYLDLGLSLSKLGEEARVPLYDFTLEGKQRAELRTALRRGEREGARFEVLGPEEVRASMGDLARVSDEWLARKAAAEKRFSIGRFEPSYLQRFPCAVVRRGEQIVAFANLHASTAQQEFAVDLMRYSDDAPKGVMDYLFVSLMLWGQAEGYRWFNLGMAPLSGLEDHPLAPSWHKFGALVQRYGEEYYNFDGLRRYKEKFAPVWRSRYLASPGGLALPRVLIDVATLIAGGMREVIRK